MKPEYLRKHMLCLLVTGGNVHPDETVLTLEQLPQLVDATLLDLTVRNKADVHSTHIPRPGLALGGCVTAAAAMLASYTGLGLESSQVG
jgi:hypothetical protein